MAIRLSQQWHQRFPMNISEFAERIRCAGGLSLCRPRVTHGSIWTVDERVYYQAKTILEWMLWETRDNLVREVSTDSVGAAE
jgi:hypothetical protein